MPVGGRESEFGDSGATGKCIVNDDRRRAGLGKVRRRDATNVPAIADGKEGKYPDTRMLGSMESAWQFGRSESSSTGDVVPDDVPKRPSDQRR